MPSFFKQAIVSSSASAIKFKMKEQTAERKQGLVMQKPSTASLLDDAFDTESAAKVSK